MRYLTIGDHYVPASTFSHSLGRQPRFPMFAESGFWKTHALAAKGSLRAWLRTHATGHERPCGRCSRYLTFATNNHRQLDEPRWTALGGQAVSCPHVRSGPSHVVNSVCHDPTAVRAGWQHLTDIFTHFLVDERVQFRVHRLEKLPVLVPVNR